MNSEMFPRTPKISCKFMAKLIPSNKKLKVLDMFAGNGNITKEIDRMHEIYAVDWHKHRVRSGEHRVPNAEWIWDDVFLRSFIDKYVLPGTFDVVIMNPDFEVCVAALYLAWAAIRNSDVVIQWLYVYVQLLCLI